MSSQTQNPYQPPFELSQPEGWWAKLRRFLRRVSLAGQTDFKGGDAIICDGITFFVDPDNLLDLYAASPSDDTSERRMELIIAESVRVVPLLLTDHPRLRALISRRRIVARMILRYSDSQAECIRQVTTDLLVADIIAESDGRLEDNNESL